VQEPGRDQPPVILVHEDPIYLKLIAFEKASIGESLVGYKDVRDDEKEKEDGSAHSLFVLPTEI
jgi:hypothetical protein